MELGLILLDRPVILPVCLPRRNGQTFTPNQFSSKALLFVCGGAMMIDRQYSSTSEALMVTTSPLRRL